MDFLSHKKARFNYEILETFEGGLELLGSEVKSVRAHHGSLEGSHIVVRASGKAGGLEAYLVGATIPPYQPGNIPAGYDPARTRKVLLTRKELATLADFEHQKGLTIVPLSVYNKGRRLKVAVAVVRGRKKYDKREVLKERTAKRDIERTLKNS